MQTIFKKKTKKKKGKKEKKNENIVLFKKIHSLFHQATPTIEWVIINCIKILRIWNSSKAPLCMFRKVFLTNTSAW